MERWRPGSLERINRRPQQGSLVGETGRQGSDHDLGDTRGAEPLRTHLKYCGVLGLKGTGSAVHLEVNLAHWDKETLFRLRWADSDAARHAAGDHGHRRAQLSLCRPAADPDDAGVPRNPAVHETGADEVGAEGMPLAACGGRGAPRTIQVLRCPFCAPGSPETWTKTPEKGGDWFC
jgi:hypothetical protein